jgi:cytoskeletal protein CcmA (bactofilin family)
MNTCSITGQVVDFAGQPMGFATVAAHLVMDQPTPQPVALSTGAHVPFDFVFQLDANGNFVGATLPRTDDIAPLGSHWNITLLSLASIPPLFVGELTLTTGVFVLATTINTALNKLYPSGIKVQSGQLMRAYSDTEIVNAKPGDTFIDIANNSGWIFSDGAWFQWANDASGGGGTPVGPVGAVQFNNAGVFGGDANLTYTPTALTLANRQFNAGAKQQFAIAIVGSDYSAITFNGNTTNTNMVGLLASDSIANDPYLYLLTPSGGGFQFLIADIVIAQFDAVSNRFYGNASNVVATIDKAGNATFVGTLHANGAVQLDSTLHVNGAITTDNNLIANGSLGVVGDASIEGNNAVGGGASVSGTLTTGQLATLQALRVLATTEFDGGVTVGDTLAVIGLSSLQGGLTVTGNETVSGTLHVLGEFSTDNNALIEGVLSVAGPGTSSFAGDVGIVGNASIGATLSLPIAGKTYNAPSISAPAGRAFATPYQNTSGMSLQLSMTATTSGSAVGSLTGLVGPTNPPANTVYKNENTASVSGAEVAVTLVIPPGWWYEIQQAGDITGIGRWWEWTCP